MGFINLLIAGGILFGALWLIRAFANTPPVSGRGAPVVPGKVMGRPSSDRTAR